MPPTNVNVVSRIRWAVLVGVLIGMLPFTAVAQDAQDDAYPDLQAIGYLQQVFVEDATEGESPRFSIYRARVGVAGAVTDRIRANVLGGAVEPPNRTPRLVNAFVDFDVHPLLQVRTGQFLVPFGLEGPEVVIFNPAIERSVATRRLNDFALLRDVGVQVSGQAAALSYAVALVNGAGANAAEEIDPKDVLGRLGIALDEDIEVGFSGHYGQRAAVNAPEHNQLVRWGLDASYQVDSVFLRAEYIHRSDEQARGDDRVQRGGYILGGYRLTDRWEAIARVDAHDPNTDAEDDRFTALTLGANYYFAGQTRLSVNYEIRDDQRAAAVGNLLWVQMQLSL